VLIRKDSTNQRRNSSGNDENLPPTSSGAHPPGFLEFRAVQKNSAAANLTSAKDLALFLDGGDAANRANDPLGRKGFVEP